MEQAMACQANAGLSGCSQWDFDQAGLMYKRHCSANDISITEEERWFKDGADVDALEIDPRDG